MFEWTADGAVLLGMSLMCVLPQVQRHGIGRALMQWGMTEADKLGLESFIEATHGGQGLYAGCGCRKVASVGVEVSLADASQEWRDLAARLLPIGYTAMWRPVLGIWEPGEPGQTWQQRLEAAGDVGISVLESCT